MAWQIPFWPPLQENSAPYQVVQALNRYFPTLTKSIRTRATVSVIYQATMTPDAGVARTFKIVATNGTAFTIANPTNPADGQDLILDLTNSSGGALGAATLGSQYVFSTSFASPGNGARYRYGFEYDGANWVESWRSSAAEPAGGGSLPDGDKGEIITSGGATVFQLTASGRIAEQAFKPHLGLTTLGASGPVLAAATLLGRDTNTGSGPAQPIGMGAALSFDGAGNIQVLVDNAHLTQAQHVFAPQHMPRIPDVRAGANITVTPDAQGYVVAGTVTDVPIDDSSMVQAQHVYRPANLAAPIYPTFVTVANESSLPWSNTLNPGTALQLATSNASFPRTVTLSVLIDDSNLHLSQVVFGAY